ncbi:oxygenase MpaB family protein [Pseudooceanicola sp. LIPI14-2-Ac024]|uniref:oxygenase MpaB family protein n=1 Tax=Pseudooceanicola sp. LIPI14-2-Ac024 TaxID=3344875 RepID=UPI0035CF00F9
MPTDTTLPTAGDDRQSLHPDPEVDFALIARRTATLEFAWDIERSLEFALFRTYAVPSISGLLAKTGEFEHRPQKRYDDTELILAEPMENGIDSPRGQAAIGRMNAMHGRYRISNDDMLYVLSTFVCEPIRWLDKYGRRPMTADEKRAWVLYYRALGTRMGIETIPDDLAGFERLNRDYEAARFRSAPSNRLIADRTTELLLGFYLPRVLFPLGRPVVRAFMDHTLLDAMDYAPAPRWLRGLVHAAMRGRAVALRVLPKRRKPLLLTERKRPSYPGGYRIEELGTFR